MELMEIVLLVLGAAIFIASFFIPERESKKTEEVSKEQIQELFEEEYETAKEKINRLTDETIDYSMEKAERSLERMTNEKMLAVGEYSDTIMTQINNNHQETVFMYDMLNKSKEDLTNLLLQTDKTAQDAYQASQDAMEACEGAKTVAKEAAEIAQIAKEQAIEAREQSVVAEENMLLARKNAQGEMASSEEPDSSDSSSAGEENTSKKQGEGTEKRRAKTPSRKSRMVNDAQLSFADELLSDEGDVGLKFSAEEESSINSNERILELHKRGKSNVAIAKELGLGVGEVKLVIDLFENK